MHLMDFVVLIGVLLTLIQTVYIMATFHAARVSATAGQPPLLKRRHFMIMSALALLSWGAFAFDYYSRSTTIHHEVLGSWARTGPAFIIDVLTGNLLEYKNAHHLLLILTLPLANVDRMTDTRLAKSAEYSITGNLETLATTLPPSFGTGIGPGTYIMNFECGIDSYNNSS
jgi:hypothetical protein